VNRSQEPVDEAQRAPIAELPPYLKIAEAASYLRVSRNMLYDEIRAGRLEVVKLNERSWRISRAALEAWIRSRVF
jgi:excisionase family DNA binding protein